METPTLKARRFGRHGVREIVLQSFQSLASEEQISRCQEGKKGPHEDFGRLVYPCQILGSLCIALLEA